MRGVAVIVLLLYFIGIMYIAIYSSLYLRKVRQARTQTGMEIPHLTQRVLGFLPPLSSVIAIFIFFLLIWESIAFFSEWS